ncbi:hypothetical protein RJ640_000411, partial [Escallonia rubra]
LDNHSLAGYKVSGISPSVVVNWVSEMVGKVLQWPLSGHDGLDEESKHGEHGESSILELLHFKLCKGLRIIGKAQGVEAFAWVVESALAEDLGSSLEPHRLTKLDAVAGQKIKEDTPESSKHCPPGMDHLKLAVLGKSFWVSRKPSGVPVVVTGEFTGEIGWSLTGEWSQVLDPVGSYHGLPDETTLLAFFLMETLPLLVISEAVGVICTAFPIKDGEERAIVAAAMAKE